MADAPTSDEMARAQAQALIERRKREGTWKGGVRAHTAYQKKPVEWIVKYLGIPENTIRWSLNPEYQSCHCPRCEEAGNEGQPHIWDGDVDPLVKALELIAEGKSVAVSSGTTTGKAAWVESNVLTPNGWVRMGDVAVGDQVVGSDGRSTTVLGVYPQGERPIYRVTFNDGAVAHVDGEHLWAVRTRGDKHRGKDWRICTTDQIARVVHQQWEVPTLSAPAEFAERGLPLDPYVLGILLGDGHIAPSPCLLGLSTADEFVVRECERLAAARLVYRGRVDYLWRDGGQTFNVLEQLGLVGKHAWDKFVPSRYLFATAEQRVALVQGLMDSDGTVEKNGTSFSFASTSYQLISDMKHLVRSLGGTTRERTRYTRYRYKGQLKTGRQSWDLWLQLPNDINPFRLPRKANRVRERHKGREARRRISAVEFAFNAEAQCIQVDARDQLYVMDDFVVTHNTYVLGAAGTLWFLAVHERSVVYNLAPKYDLLTKNMWKYIGELVPRFKRHFPHAQMLQGNLRMLNGEGEAELWTASAFGAGVGADEELAQRLKGFHQSRMLWILEELPGVNPAMVETVVKTASSDFNPIMGLGNPEHQHDPLAMFGKREWVTPIRISAFDYPNVVVGRPVVPGGRSRQSVIRDLSDCDGHPDHPFFLSQVRGIAPAQSRRALIEWKWCEAAAKRYDDPALRLGPSALGVDAADSPTGDFSAISEWQGACCTGVKPFRCEDASELGRIVAARIQDKDDPVDPRYVGIDAVGVGASTVNELKRFGVRVRLISGAMRPIPMVDRERLRERTPEDGEDVDNESLRVVVVEAERYANMRSQVYWRLREDLRLGRIALPDDRKLFEELTAMEYEEPSGKVVVAPKDAIRSLIGRSPDRADAVAYGNFVRPRIVPRATSRDIQATPQRTPNRDTSLERHLAAHEKRQARENQRFERMLKRRSRDRNRGMM